MSDKVLVKTENYTSLITPAGDVVFSCIVDGAGQFLVVVKADGRVLGTHEAKEAIVAEIEGIHPIDVTGWVDDSLDSVLRWQILIDQELAKAKGENSANPQ